MLNKYAICCLVMGLATTLGAQNIDSSGEETPQPPMEKQRSRRGGEKHGERLFKHVEAALEKVKEKDPERYEELIRLREIDKRRFMREMRSLLPSGGHGEGPREQHGRGRPQGKRFGERFFEHLKQEDPERFEKLKKLRQENPMEFRKEMAEIFKSFRKKHFKQDERIQEIVEAYRAATDEAEKTRLKAELRKVVEEGFQKRMAVKEEELEHLKSRLEELEKALESYQKSKDAICDKRVAELLDPGTDTDIRRGHPDDRRPGPGNAPRRPPLKDTP